MSDFKLDEDLSLDGLPSNNNNNNSSSFQHQFRPQGYQTTNGDTHNQSYAPIQYAPSSQPYNPSNNNGGYQMGTRSSNLGTNSDHNSRQYNTRSTRGGDMHFSNLKDMNQFGRTPPVASSYEVSHFGKRGKFYSFRGAIKFSIV